MVKTFVAINDPVHNLIRTITRHAPLCPVLSANGPLMFRYRVNAADLPAAYYSLAMFHALGGLSRGSMRLARWRVRAQDMQRLPEQVNYFDLIKLDRRCARDLRLKIRKQGPGMLAAELLSYGTGTLRARNDAPLEQLHRYLWSRHGRIHTVREVVFATIRALHWNSLPLLYGAQKESFDSTNVIYGDAIGELEQLWDRRADTAFLDQVAQSLQSMRRGAEIAAFLHPPLNVAAVMKLHLRCQSIWKRPPTTARILLRRVEHILGNTIVDSTPSTIFRYRESQLETEPTYRGGKSPQWETDLSGYDGWLGKSDESIL